MVMQMMDQKVNTSATARGQNTKNESLASFSMASAPGTDAPVKPKKTPTPVKPKKDPAPKPNPVKVPKPSKLPKRENTPSRSPNTKPGRKPKEPLLPFCKPPSKSKR